MNIPTNFFMWSMAALPIALLILLLVKFQVSATKAAPITLAVTLATGVLVYKADAALLLSEGGKGLWNAFTILLIVWTAILLYQVGNEANAFAAIRKGLRQLLPNQLLQLLAIGWVFESFLQGITGFGVPVAVGAPLLIGIGVQPLWAVIISLLGQSWGNTFGTLGAAWDALAMVSDLESGSSAYLQTALWASLFIAVWNLFTGFVMCYLYGKMQAVKKGMPAVLVIAVIQGGGEILLSQVNTTLACFIPSCIAFAAVLLLGRSRCYRENWSCARSTIMQPVEDTDEADPHAVRALLQAFVPYIVLSVLTLAALLITPLKMALEKVSFSFSFPQTVTGYAFVNESVENFSPFAPFTHASFYLLLSAVIGIWYYSRKGWMRTEQIRSIFKKSAAMTLPSGIALICLVVMSKIMDGTGQTIILANGITQVLGTIYVLLTPFVGMLGSFMTGSNMSSNILFGGFQVATAKILHISAPAMLGAQTAGGAIGSIISPSKILLGTTTADLLGSEGKVLREVFLIAIPAALLIGFILYGILCI